MPRLNFYLFCIVLSFCQSSSIRAAEDAVIEQYQQTIDELEAEYGAYDTSLAEPLSGLAEALQSSGKHQQAIAALKRSLHVRRVNDGMNSLSQEPALRLLNDSYQAVGNNGAVAANYQRRLDLLQNNNSGGAAEKLALQLEAAHWHRSQYIQLRNKQAAAHLMESIRLLADASNTSVLYNGPLKAQLLNSEIQNHYYLIQHYQRFAPRPPDDYVRRRSVRFRPRYRDETSFEYQLAYDSYIRRETARLSKRYAREQIDEAESK
ncbi:MAG: hypothetical protein OIF34_10385, partial [Porticoccaceae bacterium]|nr:hypothetical protein [Porticoccaceae bacterium]